MNRETPALQRKLLRAAMVAGALLLLAGAGVAYQDHRLQPAAPSAAELLAAAAPYDAHIRRDEWGVPHVRGARNADAAYGLAYAQAEDDFPTVVQVLLATRGRLAAVEGIGAAPTDYVSALLEPYRKLDVGYARDLPADLRAVLEGYATGLNHYAALHPDEVPPGLLPVTGHDIAAGFIFKTPFFYGLDRELRRLNDLPADPMPKGSNGVAVGPTRSADGATRLLVNSHQPYTGPVAWYEAVVESDEGWHVAGGFFPGSPFMLHGHNAHLGWANTVNAPDLVDTYRLVVDDAHPDAYRLDGRWVPFRKRDVAIRVHLFGPFHWTFHREARWSVHGPVLQTRSGTYALRFAGIGETRQALQYWRLDLARNRAEWQAAMALQALPSINYVYADEAGNIGYVYNGQFPVRRDGVDWSGILPGDRSDLVWRQYAPYVQVPQLWNPPSGVLFNANHSPFAATVGEGGLNPSSFPSQWGLQRNMTNRGFRLLETYGADAGITPEEFRRYKFDVAYSPRSAVAQARDELLAIPETALARIPSGAAAQGLLRNWNLQADRGNPVTALALAATQARLGDEANGVAPLSPERALEAGMRAVRAATGREAAPWGDVNRLRRGNQDLPLDGGPDTLRAVYGTVDRDGRLAARAGDTFIMFVSWDREGRLSSESVHQFGSATSREASPHFADQAPLFAAERTKPVRFTEAQLAGHIAEDYRPGQRLPKNEVH